MKSLATMKVVSHQLIVSCIVLYGVAGIARGEDKPPAAKPAQTDSQLKADGQSGMVNDWLRSQSSSFSAWDLGGQFRARYEHIEHLGGAADFSASDNSSDDLL